MRQRQQHHRPRPTTLSALLLLGASSLFTTPASAVPYPKDSLHEYGFGYLQPRQCAQYCGYQNQYCCAAGSACVTQAGIALCAQGAAGGGGGWAVYTTTWTSTETFTSTISSNWVPATTAVGGGGVDCIPVPGTGQIACGNICCKSDQYCAWRGQCYPNGAPGAGDGGGGGGGVVSVTTTITTGGQTITTAFSAPYRPTSDTTITQTATSSSSGTGVLVSQTSTSTGNGTATTGTAKHLSAGAIAGIVIGSLAAVALLLLICACFLVRGLWHGLMAILGMGGDKKRKRHSETIIEEERYTRHGHGRPASVHSRRDNHGGWFGGAGGGRPSTVSGRKEKKKSSGLGLLGLGAAAGTLLLLLGLRKDKKKQQRPVKTRSDVSSSYFGSDSYTVSSPSSASTRRTRESRHSRGTRTTRHSRPPSVRP